jgi:hypothetical protein
MRRVRVFAILLCALGVSLPLLSMIPAPSRMECPKGACFSNGDCPDGATCNYDPPFVTCGVCEL